MKKFLALVLTLAMVLTLNVGMIASAADDAHVNVAGQQTATVDGVVYTVITDLTAVSTKGNYILANDVAVAKNAVITIAAGTVLNGNGYTISVTGNDYSAPLSTAPFALAAGEAITITNVNFGSADAPICFASTAPEVEGAVASDLGLFANDAAPVVDETTGEVIETPLVAATFKNVDFAVYASDVLNVNVGGVMAIAHGDYTFEDCSMACTFEVANASEVDPRNQASGYVGGFIGQAAEGGSVSFEACETTVGSVIVNDYRTGGFVGYIAGGMSLVDCVNNATVDSLTLIAGGFIGYVEGETLSAWTLEGCVNNGNVTAYMGAVYTEKVEDGVDAQGNTKYKDVTHKHGDTGRSAGALVGYIYKEADGLAPRITVIDCVNNGNVYGEDRLSGLLGDNRVTFGPEYLAEDGVTKMYEEKTPMITNCVNNGDVVCTVRDALSGAHVLGGLTSRPQGPMTFTNCKNFGRVDANGMNDGHLGGMVGNTSAVSKIDSIENAALTFNYCNNYGTVANGRRIGGIAGTVETRVIFNGCVNYGSIISGTSTRADNHAGGIAGFADNFLSKWNGCINLGSINGTHAAGGILAYSRNLKDAAIEINQCFNFGEVVCIDGFSGGIVGKCLAPLTIVNTMNAGYVTSTVYMVASQLVAVFEGTCTMGNNFVFGTVGQDVLDNFPPKADGILSDECDKADAIVLAEGAEFLAAAIGTTENLEHGRNVAVTAEDALAAIVEIFGEDVPVYLIDGKITYVEPAIRGVQLANEAKDGKVDVRFVGVVNGMTYEAVKFTYKVNGTEKTANAAGLLDIKGTNVSGEVETRDAAALGGAAMYTVVIAGVATTGTVEVEITMTATSNGVDYTSEIVYVTITDGVVTNTQVGAVEAE